jgi:hypothetical protein
MLIWVICSIIHVLDRPCSFSILLPKQTGLVGDTYFVSSDLSMDSTDNTVIFDAMVEVIKKSERDKVSLWSYAYDLAG